LYSIGELEAANEEYSIAVRQRAPYNADTKANQAARAAASGGKKSRRGGTIAEELGVALRQAPAAADAGNIAETIAEHQGTRELSSLSSSKE
jgi:hypothetical protein